VKLDWEAGPITVRADRGRLSQALGNLLSNAVEHGGARVLVTGRRSKRGVRIEVRDSGRGHGLGIAKRAVGEAGGSLSAEAAGAGRAYAIDLPIEPDGRPLREAGSAEPLASPLSPDSPAAA
jgi:signal transduction histidine kinase